MFARWAELVGEEVAQHATPESFADGTLVVRTDSTAWATQLKLLAPGRRPAPQRGPRPRHGHPDRGARPPPAELEEGAPVGPRRTRAARHLRLSRARAATADLRASRTYRDSTDPLSGPAEPSRAAQGRFSAPVPPLPGDGDVECGPLTGYHGHRVASPRQARRRDPCRVHRSRRRGVRERGTDRRIDVPQRRPHLPSPRSGRPTSSRPTSTATTTPRRSRCSRASRPSASARACTSAPPVSAACTT